MRDGTGDVRGERRLALGSRGAARATKREKVSVGGDGRREADSARAAVVGGAHLLFHFLSYRRALVLAPTPESIKECGCPTAG